MDPLAWLGLRKGRSEYPRLSALRTVVRELLPDDEAVVIRYIVVVAVLLSRVAFADGRFLECEREHLRLLFQHIDRMPPDGIERLTVALNEHAEHVSNDELELCYLHLQSLNNLTPMTQRISARQTAAA